MKLGTINHQGRPALVAMKDGGVALLSELYESAGLGNAPASMNDLIEGGAAELAKARQALEQGNATPLAEPGIDWLPPQTRPSKVLGVAFNNMGIRKSAHKDPGVPNFFLKAPSCLTGHGKPVIMEEHYGETIPELELAAVLGKRCKNVSVEEARAAVFGYTITNDVTSHGLKFGLDSIATTREPDLIRPHHLAWRNSHGEDDRDVYFVYHTRSKATDTFGPIGPWLTTADEVADPNALEVKGWFDGEPFAVDFDLQLPLQGRGGHCRGEPLFYPGAGRRHLFRHIGQGRGKIPERAPLSQHAQAFRRHRHRDRRARPALQPGRPQLEVTRDKEQESAMRVIEFAGAGGPEVLRIAEHPRPAPEPGEVLIRVVAAGVNRPDIQQRRGLYPPPPGASPIPGLDVAGIVEEIGPDVKGVSVGDAVCALANGGGYAEYCCVPVLQCMPIPRGFTFIEAASLPEVYFTAWNNVIWLGRLAQGESLLVQGGTSGVGMAAIQIACKLRNAKVYATAGTEEKLDVCRDVGALAAVSYKGPWDQEFRALTGGDGVDVILDAQAGPYTQRQLDLLKPDGRLVFIASHLGETAEVNIRSVVRRRLTLAGSTLRPRPAEYKGRIASELVEQVWPLLESGAIATRIHAVFPFDEVRSAHRLLDGNEQIGKVVLGVDAALAETVACDMPDGRN